ncbi:hypothetical protein FQA39_LY03095 [Lamprigera yunnana]|nr:hypothetical protein FQA39_LY03095 [Lamprigera yunnana]
MQSRKLKEFYDNLVVCVIVQKFKRGEIRRMAAAAVVGDVDGEMSMLFPMRMDVYEILEQTLNYKCNINSYNVLCIMEAYRHRPGYIMNSSMCRMDNPLEHLFQAFCDILDGFEITPKTRFWPPFFQDGGGGGTTSENLPAGI